MPYKTSELVTLDKFIFSAFNGLIKRGPLEFYCIQVKSVFHILCSSPSCGSFKCSKCFQFQVSKSASYICFLFWCRPLSIDAKVWNHWQEWTKCIVSPACWCAHESNPKESWKHFFAALQRLKNSTGYLAKRENNHQINHEWKLLLVAAQVRYTFKQNME